MLVVDKNIPVRESVASTYPFSKMRPGKDSCFVSLDGRSELAVRGSIYTAAKAKGIIVKTAKEEGGIRFMVVSESHSP